MTLRKILALTCLLLPMMASAHQFETGQCIDSLEVRKKPGGHWIIRDLAGLDLVGLASQ